MMYAVEHENDRENQARGPFRTGAQRSLADAKRAAEALAQREGFTNVVIRDRGDVTSPGAGDVVAELVDGVWHDRGWFDVRNWWPKLDEESRAWLLEHPYESVPTDVLHRVVAVGGVVPGTRWDGAPEYDFRIPEAAADWIARQADR